MFEGTIASGLMEQEDKINFDNLTFPIYKKDEYASEWYRFDSISEFITVRGKGERGDVISIGTIKGLDKLTFVDLYSNRKDCTEQEFNAMFHKSLIALQDIIMK